MRAFGFSALFIVLIIQLGVWSLASSQDVVPFGEDPEFFGEEFEETEQLPQFQVEVLVFAYNAFDPTEEQFHRKPRPAPLDTVRGESDAPGELAEPLDAPPPGVIDPYQQPPVWPPRETEPVQTVQPAEPAVPGFGDPAAGDELEPGTLDGENAEEALSVSEQILATLLALEDKPDPLDPLAQETAADPGLQGSIAAEESLGSLDPPQSESLAEEPAEEPFQFRFLSREELGLTEAFGRLENLDAYTVLAHGGWVQAGLPEDGAHPFDLSLLGVLNPVGTVQLHLSRFLHVTVALDYQARNATAPPPLLSTYSDVLEEISLPAEYELRATRRTRSGELHYFDHPAFGVLVIVRPQPEDPGESGEPLNPPLGPAA